MTVGRSSACQISMTLQAVTNNKFQVLLPLWGATINFSQTRPRVIKGSLKENILLLYTAIPYRVSTGPVQGQYRAWTGFSLRGFPHREKPVFFTGNPCSYCRDPVFITGISLCGKTHRGNPVFITGQYLDRRRNLYGRMDGSKFWHLLWFPDNFLLWLT